MSLLKRLFAKSHAAQAPFGAEVVPDAAFFAVGDVHGCLPQMLALLDKLTQIDPDAPIIFVGDYVDRGEDSASVLRHLFDRRDDPKQICITGNHEDMMLQFLATPAEKGARWLRFGGLQTLASFGVGGVTPNSQSNALVKAADDLTKAMGPQMLDWLQKLPSMWQSGNVAVVHAGANPELPIALQSAQTLAWGHSNFDTTTRQDGTWILHGHTIVDAAYAKDGRIAIDTGAYATGQLTAAHVTPDGITFLHS